MRYELRVGASESFVVGGDVYDSLDVDVLPSATGGHDTVRLVAAPSGGIIAIYGSKADRAGFDASAIQAVRLAIARKAPRRPVVPGEPDVHVVDVGTPGSQ